MDYLSKEKIVKDTTKYSLATIASQAIGVITSVLLRKLLDPSLMGIWTGLMIVLNYGLYADFGLFSAATVKIPYYKGKKEKHKIEKIMNLSFTVSIVAVILLAAMLIIVSFFLGKTFSLPVITGIRIVSFIMIATILYNFNIVMLRANKQFTMLSKVEIFNSAVTLVTVILLVTFFKLYGLYYGTLLAVIASFLYSKSISHYDLKLYFDIKELSQLIKVGLPLAAYGFSFTILISLDKIVIAKAIGAKDLGFYSIAVLAFTYALTFSKLFGIVTLPSIQESYGETGSIKHIMRYVKKPTLILAYLLPLLLAFAYFMIPFLVHYFLPKYREGITSMKIILGGCFFISLTYLAQNFLTALDKQIQMIPFACIAAAAGLVLDYIFIKMNMGITGVALGTSISFFIFFFIIMVHTLKHCDTSIEISGFFVNIILIFIYSFGLLFLVEKYVLIDRFFLKTLVHMVLFYLCYLPAVLFIIRDKPTKEFLFRLKASLAC
ncbi:MAG: oligosaccharide flippase family protein [Candidatus Omnitrophica bacterium]|nr:oligosaccharide flippase family protein [Candidatus Omnitrophota bacterium]